MDGFTGSEYIISVVFIKIIIYYGFGRWNSLSLSLMHKCAQTYTLDFWLNISLQCASVVEKCRDVFARSELHFYEWSGGKK